MPQHLTFHSNYHEGFHSKYQDDKTCNGVHHNVKIPAEYVKWKRYTTVCTNSHQNNTTNVHIPTACDTSEGVQPHILKTTVFQIVAPCSMGEVYWCF
jgi:hypothetical protein